MATKTLLVNNVTQTASSDYYELGQHVRSLKGPHTLEIRRKIAFDEPNDWAEDVSVELQIDGTTTFKGYIPATARAVSTSEEHINYQAIDGRYLLQKLFAEYGGNQRIVYNAEEPEDDDVEADYLPLSDNRSTVQAILQNFVDLHRVELSGTIGDGSTGGGYYTSETDQLKNIPGKIVLDSVSLEEGIDQILSRWQPNVAWYIDPALDKLRIVDFGSLTTKTLTFGTDLLTRPQINCETQRVFSAAQLLGDYERIDVLATLTPAWDSGYEATWSHENAQKYPETHGKVWRYFSMGHSPIAERRVTGKRPVFFALFDYLENAHPITVPGKIDLQAGTVMLHLVARQWSGGAATYEAPDVLGRYTYKSSRVSVSYPTSGYTGTGYSERGIEKTYKWTDEERIKKSIQGAVDELSGDTRIRSYRLHLRSAENAGAGVIVFHSDGSTFESTLDANSIDEFDLFSGDPDIATGDTFSITLEDDSALKYESDTISGMGLMVREWLNRYKDIEWAGELPLATLDYTVDVGQKINLEGTTEDEYDTMSAPVAEVHHDLANDFTRIILTNERFIGGPLSYEDLIRNQNLDREVKENRRRIRTAFTENHPGGGNNEEEENKHDGKPKDEAEELTGDGNWTERDDTATPPELIHTQAAGVIEANSFGDGSGTVPGVLSVDTMGHLRAASCSAYDLSQLVGAGLVWDGAEKNIDFSMTTLDDWITGSVEADHVELGHSVPQSENASFGNGANYVVGKISIDERGHLIIADCGSYSLPELAGDGLFWDTTNSEIDVSLGGDDWIDTTVAADEVTLAHSDPQAESNTFGDASQTVVGQIVIDAKGHVKAGSSSNYSLSILAGQGLYETAGTIALSMGGDDWISATVNADDVALAHEAPQTVDSTFGDASGTVVGLVVFDARGHAVTTSAQTYSLSALAGDGLSWDNSGKQIDISMGGDTWLDVTVNTDDVELAHTGPGDTGTAVGDAAAAIVGSIEYDTMGHVYTGTTLTLSTIAGDGLSWDGTEIDVDMTGDDWIGVTVTTDQVTLAHNDIQAVSGDWVWTSHYTAKQDAIMFAVRYQADLKGHIIGLRGSWASLHDYAGNGLTFDTTDKEFDVGVTAPLVVTTDAVELSYSDGLGLSGSQLVVQGDAPIAVEVGGNVILNYAGGLTLDSDDLVVSLSDGLTLSGEAIVVQLSGGLDFDSGMIYITYDEGLEMSGSRIRHTPAGSPVGTHTITEGGSIVLDTFGHVVSVN